MDTSSDDDDWWITEPQINAWALNEQGYDRTSYNEIPITQQLGITDMPGTIISDGWTNTNGTAKTISEILTAWLDSKPEERITGQSSRYLKTFTVLSDLTYKFEMLTNQDKIDLNSITYADLDKVAIDLTMRKLLDEETVLQIITGVTIILTAAAPEIQAGAVSTYNKTANAWNNNIAGIHGLNFGNLRVGGRNFALPGGGTMGNAIPAAVPLTIPQVAVWSPAITGSAVGYANPSALIAFAASGGTGSGGNRNASKD